MKYFHRYWEQLFFTGSHCQYDGSNIVQNLLSGSPRSIAEACLLLDIENYDKYLAHRVPILVAVVTTSLLTT